MWKGIDSIYLEKYRFPQSKQLFQCNPRNNIVAKTSYCKYCFKAKSKIVLTLKGKNCSSTQQDQHRAKSVLSFVSRYAGLGATLRIQITHLKVGPGIIPRESGILQVLKNQFGSHVDMRSFQLRGKYQRMSWDFEGKRDGEILSSI